MWRACLGGPGRPRGMAVLAVASVAALGLGWTLTSGLHPATRWLLPPALLWAGVLLGRSVPLRPGRRAPAADTVPPSAAEEAGADSPATLRIDQAALELRQHMAEMLTHEAARDDVVVAGPWLARQDDIAWATAELATYPTFTDILTKQMGSVTHLSEETATGLLGSLTDVDGRIGALLAFIQQSGSNERVSEVVSQIEAQMAGCRALLDDLAQRQRADAEVASGQRERIVAETRQILDALAGVDRIAQHTTILSLNVSIEAARIGPAGRGFGVIGEEIRTVTSEVQHLSREMKDRVSSLIGVVTIDLHNNAVEREANERASILHISDTLGALTDNLTTLLIHQRDILHKVESENESVAKPILAMMGSMQFQDIIRQQLEHMTRMAEMVGDHLLTIAETLGERGAAPADSRLSDKLDELFGGYVMDHQRVAHRAAQGQAMAANSGAMIELF